MQEQPNQPIENAAQPGQALRAYESPKCETHSPLEHVRAWQDNSSELEF